MDCGNPQYLAPAESPLLGIQRQTFSPAILTFSASTLRAMDVGHCARSSLISRRLAASSSSVDTLFARIAQRNTPSTPLTSNLVQEIGQAMCSIRPRAYCRRKIGLRAEITLK
jgi:hypothetical protein